MPTERSGAAVLVIEIGGTKLQWGLTRDGGRTIEGLVRAPVDRAAGADGILAVLESELPQLVAGVPLAAIGVGFGGPVVPGAGTTLLSHQIDGWEHFPLADWFQRRWSTRCVVLNDCNAAALAEARWGAGRGRRRVLYVTVGTGVGGGLVIDGQLDGADCVAMAEIGHLRPGLSAVVASDTVESFASGMGIERRAEQFAPDAPSRTAEELATAAREGDAVALQVWREATQTLGWAIAQSITLLAPDVVVIGGGLARPDNRDLFWNPLRSEVGRYVFPELAECYQLLPSELQDTVVLHGAGLAAVEELDRHANPSAHKSAGTQ